MTRRIRYTKSGTQIKTGARKTISQCDYFCFSTHNPVEAAKRGLQPCKGTMIRESVVADHITEKLFARVDEEYIAAGLAAKQGPSVSASTTNGDGYTEGLRKRLAQLERKEGRLLDLYEEETLDKKALVERTGALRQQVEEVESELRAAEARAKVKADKVERIAAFTSLRDDWQYLTVPEQREILGVFVERVTVSRGHTGGTGTHPRTGNSTGGTCQKGVEERVNIEWIE